ncbi:MAG: HAMP domain-containing histidine kinase, partial [Nitrosopumilus sp.]|nr:HAMP domain-containing histidine kinase [Nitrosopumilus sp.]
STIKMGLELIKNKENLSSSSHEKIKMIDSAIFRMTHQIDDVLDYVRTTPLNSTRCKIDEIIEESIIRSNLPETIRVEFEKSSVEVECDKEKIIIVFVNLFKNAKEAMNGKGELIIKIKSLPQNLQIIIENSGPPIPSKNLDSIFLPLFTTKSTGTELGLATCKSIISQHNGTILVVNDPTRFVITIPQKT